MSEWSSSTVTTAPREVMDIRQAAEYLGISGDTLYRYASEGFVPCFKLGNRWRFRKRLLDGWMDEKSGVKAVELSDILKPPAAPRKKGCTCAEDHNHNCPVHGRELRGQR